MRLLWHVGFYDGPLSGICVFRGRKHWFRIRTGICDPDIIEREFEIVYLTDEQISAEEERQALFREYVGNHCNYDENNKRPIGDLKPGGGWKNFYDLPPLERNYLEVVRIVSEEELRSASEA